MFEKVNQEPAMSGEELIGKVGGHLHLIVYGHVAA